MFTLSCHEIYHFHLIESQIKDQNKTKRKEKSKNEKEKKRTGRRQGMQTFTLPYTNMYTYSPINYAGARTCRYTYAFCSFYVF